MVIKKPIQFTMVNAVPFSFEFEFCATKVENRGESAITTNPQKNKKIEGVMQCEISEEDIQKAVFI